MSRTLPCLLLLAALLLPVKGHATAAAATHSFSRAQVSAEGLGAGLLYSVFGSYRPIRQLAVNLGVSYWTLDGGITLSTGTINIFVLPISVSYLLGGESHNLEILAGGDLIFTSGQGTFVADSKVKTDFTNRHLMPVFGLGYRYWPSDGGFHFRATAYVFVANSVYPWGGLSLGYAF